LPVPEGFLPEEALAALRSLPIAPLSDASRALPAPLLARTHLTNIDEMSSNQTMTEALRRGKHEAPVAAT
jgi:hypothetical protein